MPEPLDEQYLKWLYARIGSVQVTDQTRTYWKLLRHLYSKEFVWLVANDDNRVEDGRDLRLEFLDIKKRQGQEAELWMGLGCSMLEMLIGLAIRYSFEDDGQPRSHFWQMLDNLGLGDQNDAQYNSLVVEDAIEQLIWRTYESNGRGGLFPLQDPDQDQRRVEIWFQLCSYILERM